MLKLKTSNRQKGGKPMNPIRFKRFINKLTSWVLLLAVISWSVGTQFFNNTPIAQAVAPTILMVEQISPNMVMVVYSEAMDNTTTTNATYYTFSGSPALNVVDVLQETTTEFKVITDGDIVAGAGGNTLTVTSSVLDAQAEANATTGAQIITAPIRIRISELSAEMGSATAEFVELYNDGSSPVDISGWELQYNPANGSGWVSPSLATVPGTINSGTTNIAAFSFYLFSTADFDTASATNGNQNFTAGLDLAGGHVRLFNGSQEIDKVGWGTAVAPEGSAATVHAATQSIERKAFGSSQAIELATGGIDAGMGNGWDTDNNSFDFVVQASPSPQNSSSIAEEPNFTGYEGAAGNGPMIMHMPINSAGGGAALELSAQVGDPVTPLNEITAELHYMVGDGTPANGIIGDYTTIIGVHQGNGIFKFTIPSGDVVNNTDLYYYLKAITTSNTAFMSADPGVDTGTYGTITLQEDAVAQNPFIISVVDGSSWDKSITGIVSDGSVISGVMVILEGTSFSTITNGSGVFNLTGLPEGIYNLTLIKDGYYDGFINDIFLSSTYDIGTYVMEAGTSAGSSGDTSKPMVMFSGPPDGMFGAPPGDDNFKVFVGFNKDIDSSTFDTTNVFLTTDGTNAIAGFSVIYDNDPSDNAADNLPPDQYLGIVSPPAGGFLADTTYYLVMTGSVRDTVGNPLQGNRPEGGHVISFTTGGDFMGGGAGGFDPSGDGAWDDFGTGAMMPPMVIGVSPNDGQMEVVPNTKVNITFSDPMDSSSVTTSGNIKLYSVSVSNNAETTVLISSATTLDTSQKNATLTPVENLLAGRYRVVITGALQSANGIFMGDPGQSLNVSSYNFYETHFEVGSGVAIDETHPTVLGSWPADNQTGIAVNPGMMSIQFSEGMDPSSINSNTITLKRGSSVVNSSVNYDPMARSASITPNAVLATSTDYTLTVTTGATDAVGNTTTAYQAIFTTSATGDTQAPSIMFTNGDEFGVAITFSEPMKAVKITDTANWGSSVLNSANYKIKFGAPATDFTSAGTAVVLSNAQFQYDEMGNTVIIENLGLTFAAGNDLYVDMTPVNVSGSGASDLSGNLIDGNFQTPMQDSSDTMGNLGPMMGGMSGGMMGPAIGDMGMMKAGVFPMNAMAGQTTIYFVDIPVSNAITDGSSIVLTYPTGFDVSGAKKDTYSPVNNDINEWNEGVIAFSSANEIVVENRGGANSDGVTVDTSARSVTITLAVTGSPTANDFLHLDLAGITNSSIPRDFDTSGYTVDIKVMKANGSLSETVTGMPFFINAGGSASLSGNITGIEAADVDGSGDEVKVFLGSPMTGPMEATAAIDVNGAGSYSFTGLPAGDYMVFTDPTITLDGADYSGSPMPEHINISDSASATKDIALTKQQAGAGFAQITVTVTGVFGTDDIDIFAGSPQGFRVKTISNAGTNPSPVNLFLPDGDWMIGMGPAMPKGPMAGPPPMPDWMPPMPVTVKVSNSGTVVSQSAVALTVNSANMQIIGYVQDDSGAAIADTEVFAYQPNGIGMGANTKTDTAGKFTLKIAQTGIYSVGVFKPGLPNVPDRSVLVLANNDIDSPADNDGNSTADVSVDGSIINSSNKLIFKLTKPDYVISGKVTDGTNPISYAPVWAYQSDGYGGSDTMTDSSGNYILYVGNGAWVVNANIPGYGDAEPQTVVINGSDMTQNLTPDSNAIYYDITGTVTINGNAQTFMPIRAVKYDSNGVYQGQEYSSMTDSSGQYTIKAKAGIYRVDIWTPDFGEVERTDDDDYANNPANLNLTADKSGVNIIVGSGALNLVTLEFTNGLNTQAGFVNIDKVDATTDPNNPIPTGFNKRLRVNDLSSGDSLYLQNGDYFFFVDVPGVGGFEPNAVDAVKRTVVISGAKTITFDLPDTTSAADMVTISGTVSDSSGGLADAWVWIGSPSTGYNQGTNTAADGSYSLALPVGGSYKIGADKPGYMSAEPADADLTDTNADGAADTAQNFTLTAQGNTISGYLFADIAGGTANTLDSGEEVPNGFVYAEETTTGTRTHASVDGSGYYSIGVVNGTWKVYGAADGYQDTQYSVAGAAATLVVSSANLTDKNIKLATDSNWTNKTKNKQITPASGGVMDDTASGGTGVKLTIPPNALGSSSSAGSVTISETAAVATTSSATPFAGKGKSIGATDNSGQPITTLNDYIDVEIEYTKADIDAQAAADQLQDKSKLKTMQNSYFDSTVDDWVALPTTKSAQYKTTADANEEWKTYQGDADKTGYEKFIDDVLVNESIAVTDYKLVLASSTNHFTIFGATIPTDSTAPSAPTGLSQTSGSGTSVVLDWADNSEADLLEYEIYRATSTGVSKSSAQANSSQVAGSTFTDSGTTAWTSYFYTVTAADDSGNESVIAAEVQMCSNSSVSNGTVVVDCTITCSSGYSLSGNSCVAPGGGGGGGGDISAPSISNISVSTADTAATVSWKTNEKSLSWILYGENTIYGGEIKTTNYSTSHTAALTGLTPATTYHYQVKSKDSSGNAGTYTDKTFTTLKAGQEVKPEEGNLETPTIKEAVEEAVNTAKQKAQKFVQKIVDIASEAVEIIKANVNSLLSSLGIKRDLTKERDSLKNYFMKLIKDVPAVTQDQQYTITNFITYGTETTIKLGEGERAGVLNSYKAAFGKLPTAENEWSDAIKIANGRWPSETNEQTETNAAAAFKKIYLREPDRSDPHDDAAVVVIAYGLRPADRNLDSEKAAIGIFRSIYGYNPESATAWDIVRAIAYSGATR